MTREEVKQILISGGHVKYHVWTFWEGFMDCWEDNCCYSTFENIGECLDSIESYCGGDWSEVNKV